MPSAFRNRKIQSILNYVAWGSSSSHSIIARFTERAHCRVISILYKLYNDNENHLSVAVELIFLHSIPRSSSSYYQRQQTLMEWVKIVVRGTATHNVGASGNYLRSLWSKLLLFFRWFVCFCASARGWHVICFFCNATGNLNCKLNVKLLNWF